jgi:superkiller protein 3
VSAKERIFEMEDNILLFPFGLMICLLLVCCGCISPTFPGSDKNQSQFVDEMRTGQSYYDNLVKGDPMNATAWFIRGNYYNNAFNQYDKALQSYNRSLELNPEYGYAWFSKGITLQNMQYYDEAKGCFETAVRYDLSFNPSVSRIVP